jgi:2-haloacid dehalogenase
VQAHEIIFQSSNAWDACGASVFGFNVAWINRFGQSRERLPGKPDFEIKTLMELTNILDGS